MKIQSIALAIVTTVGVFSGACSSGSGNSPGSAGASTSGGAVGASGSTGSAGAGTGTGGSSGGGPAGTCSNVTACGGSVVGSWSVASSCLTVSGTVDLTMLGVGCAAASVSGSLQVTGSWSAKADGTYLDNTTTSGTEQIALPASCLNVSGATTTCLQIGGPLQALGYSAVSCTDAAGGGCTCAATVQQKGGIGLLNSAALASGNFTTAANVLTTDAATNYSYCVAANTLTLTPQSTTPTTTGTVVLQNGTGGSGTAGSGAGGASGGDNTGGTAAGGTNAGGTSSGGAGAGGTGAGGTHMGGAGGGTAGAGGGTSTRSAGPCDLYSTASTPCAAAYSMIRALSKGYTGPLYQVRSGSSSQNTGTGGTTKDIGITADGFADTATQDTFCAGSTCTVSILYDQSGNKNNLKVAPAGLAAGGTYAAMPDFESSATKGSLTVGGHKVYSLYMNAREGYRLTAKGAGMPIGNTDQGIYMLADGTHYGTACCWDFGNVTTNPAQYHTMNTLFLGTGYWGTGAGSGPWFLGDFEGGVWAGGSGASNVNNPSSPSMKVPFALGMIKTSSGKYAIRVANVQSATDLTTAYDGTSPKAWDNQGGILLGIGADNSNNSWGTFFEGAITAGRPPNDTDLAVMKNVQAAGYGK